MPANPVNNGKPLESMVEALKLLRNRDQRIYMETYKNTDDQIRYQLFIDQPSLASDKKIIEAIMALGVRYYKIEKRLPP